MHRTVLPFLAMSLAAVAAACSDGASDFYEPPSPLPGGPHGTLIRSEPIPPLAPGSRALRVLHTSEAVDGRPIAVSGLVAVPDGPPPPGGWPVVSWAHGTKGVADPCAPSRGFRTTLAGAPPEDPHNHDFYAAAPEILAQGWVAVSTDYEGLGTPGLHPYLVGPSEGRGVLDIVRAARQLEGIDLDGRVAVWGRSQGGHAALFAGELAPTWTPELDVVGIVSAAPSSSMVLVAAFAPSLPSSRGFFWQAAIGFTAAYPELSLEGLFEDEARAEMDRLLAEERCSRAYGETSRPFDQAGLTRSPLLDPAWVTRLAESSPGKERLPMPVLLHQGLADDIVPAPLTVLLVQDLCRIGTDLEHHYFPGESHDDSTARHMPEILAWTHDRFDGRPTSPTCR